MLVLLSVVLTLVLLLVVLVNDSLIHLTHPEEAVFFDLTHGLLKGQA